MLTPNMMVGKHSEAVKQALIIKLIVALIFYKINNILEGKNI